MEIALYGEEPFFLHLCMFFFSLGFLVAVCFGVGFFVPCHYSANGSTHISELGCDQADTPQVPLQLLSTKHTAH